MIVLSLLIIVQEKRHLLDKLILQDDPHPVIKSLIETLLEGCRDPHAVYVYRVYS
jgi:hypothetical protein